MKRLHQRLFLLLLLAALLLLCACIAEVPHSHSSDIFDPPDFEPTPAPSGWATIQYGYDVHHVRNESVAIETVPARRIGLPDDAGVIKPMPDGGCLYISAIQTGEAEPERMAPHCLHVIRFEADGSVVLSRTYGELPFFGYLISVCVFEDGGFAAYMNRDADGAEPFAYEGLLYRFDADGTPLYQSSVSPAPYWVFALPDGAAIGAGAIEYPPVADSTANGIALCRFESGQGTPKQTNLTDEGFANVSSASYDPAAGLVLCWRSVSSRGSTRHLTCCNEDISIKWQTDMPDEQQPFEVFTLRSGGVLATGTLNEMDSSYHSVLFHYDQNGQNDWTYTTQDTRFGSIAILTELADGKFAVGFRYFQEAAGIGSDIEERTAFAVLSENGEPIQMLEPIYGYVRDVVPTADGGFIAVLYQSVRTLPQPSQISSIWMDTEAVVVRYDADFNVIWLRTVDQYKHEKRNDIIVVTSDGELLIG